MLNRRISALIIFLAAAIITLNICYNSGDSNSEVANKKEKLKKGKLKGTYSFFYKVHFNEHFKPYFPVDIQISKGIMNGKALYSKRIENGEDTTISLDLSPGKYFINYRPIKEIHRNEFYSEYGFFEIDKNGLLKYSPGDFNLVRRIKVYFPQGNFTIPDDKESLKLEWISVQNAVSYEVYWEIESKGKGNIIKRFKKHRINKNFFKFDFDINTVAFNENQYRIVWSLDALNKSGVSIGHASNSFIVNINK